jgi:hypothetical protein
VAQEMLSAGLSAKLRILMFCHRNCGKRGGTSAHGFEQMNAALKRQLILQAAAMVKETTATPFSGQETEALERWPVKDGGASRKSVIGGFLGAKAPVRPPWDDPYADASGS